MKKLTLFLICSAIAFSLACLESKACSVFKTPSAIRLRYKEAETFFRDYAATIHEYNERINSRDPWPTDVTSRKHPLRLILLSIESFERVTQNLGISPEDAKNVDRYLNLALRQIEDIQKIIEAAIDNSGGLPQDTIWRKIAHIERIRLHIGTLLDRYTDPNREQETSEGSHS